MQYMVARDLIHFVLNFDRHIVESTDEIYTGRLLWQPATITAL